MHIEKNADKLVKTLRVMILDRSVHQAVAQAVARAWDAPGGGRA